MKPLELAAEEEFLREALQRNVDGPFEEVGISARKTLQWLDDKTPTPQVLFLASLSYYATGEGNRNQLICRPARCRRDFIHSLMRDLEGHYFVIGCDVYENEIPDDPVVNYLLSPALRRGLQMELDSEHPAYFELNVLHYVNGS